MYYNRYPKSLEGQMTNIIQAMHSIVSQNMVYGCFQQVGAFCWSPYNKDHEH